MTVQATPNFITYVGDNAQTVFNFTFRVDDVAWLSVDFAAGFSQFNLNADQDTNPGGNATYSVPPPTLQNLTITRATPNTQELDYTRYDPFDSESNEDALDRLTMQIQDLSDTLGNLIAPGTVQGSILRFNTLKPVPGYDEFGVNPSEFLLPLLDGSPGQVLVTDGLGQLGWAGLPAGSLGTLQDVTTSGNITDQGIVFRNLINDAQMTIDVTDVGGPVNMLADTSIIMTGDPDLTFAFDIAGTVLFNPGGNNAMTIQNNFVSVNTDSGGFFVIRDDIGNDISAAIGGNAIVWFPNSTDDWKWILTDGMEIVFEEKSASLLQAVGNGAFWVRDDTVCVPMFTGEDDVDTLLDPTISEVIQTGVNRVGIIGDRGKTVEFIGAVVAQTLTIPDNATVPHPVGTILRFVNSGAGATTISIAIGGSDTLVLAVAGTTGVRTLATDGRAKAQKMSATRWLIDGPGLT